MPGDTIKVGDLVRLSSGVVTVITEILSLWQGLYQVETGGLVFRYEFQPMKWSRVDTIGDTGIGVCAKNGSKETMT